MEEPLFLRTVAANDQLVDDFKPGSGKHFVIEHLSLNGCPGARRAWKVDEQVVAHPQVLAGTGSSRRGRLVITHLLLLLGSGPAGLSGRPLAGLLSGSLVGLLGGVLRGVFGGLWVHRGGIWAPKKGVRQG